MDETYDLNDKTLPMDSSRKILFLVTEDWFFLSHRLDLARYLSKNGFSVAVGCRVSQYGEQILEEGFTLFDLPFARESISPISVLKVSIAIHKTIKFYKPDLVIPVALRPICLCWLAVARHPSVAFLQFMVGRGSLFTQTNRTSWKLRVARMTFKHLLTRSMKSDNAHNVFLNHDDAQYFSQTGFAPKAKCHVIPGPGIDTKLWKPQQEPTGTPLVVLFIGRLLRDKGVEELVEASRILTERRIPHRLQLAGRIDSCNPNSYSEQQIKQWEKEIGIEYLGQRSDPLKTMSDANIIAMPSYLEGFGRVLLEAGLVRRAVVTCDTTGCRSAVRHMDNGLLVPPQDALELANAIQYLLSNHNLRNKLAMRNYERVCTEFSNETVLPQFYSICCSVSK